MSLDHSELVKLWNTKLTFWFSKWQMVVRYSTIVKVYVLSEYQHLQIEESRGIWYSVYYEIKGKSCCKNLISRDEQTDPGPGITKWHDDVIKWKYFPRYWPFVRGIHRSPVNSPHKGQWRGALVFSFICAWINGWVQSWGWWIETPSRPLWRHCNAVTYTVIGSLGSPFRCGDNEYRQMMRVVRACVIVSYTHLILTWRPYGVIIQMIDSLSSACACYYRNE